MPNTSTPTISSEVAIGRRMNGSAMLMGACPASARRPGGLGGQQSYPSAIGQPILPVNHDMLSRGQSLADDRDAVLHRGDLDRAALDRVVAADDIGVVAVRT